MLLGRVYAEAGVASPKVARFAALQGLAGAEFLAGVPGSVGGALAMNAGCYGGETWDIVARAITIDRAGRAAQPREIRVRDLLPALRAPGGGHPGAGRMVRRGLFRPYRRRRRGLARQDQGIPVAARRLAAAAAAQRRQRVPQSHRRPRGATDRGLRPERARREAARGSRKSTPTSSSIRRARRRPPTSSG